MKNIERERAYFLCRVSDFPVFSVIRPLPSPSRSRATYVEAER